VLAGKFRRGTASRIQLLIYEDGTSFASGRTIQADTRVEEGTLYKKGNERTSAGTGAFILIGNVTVLQITEKKPSYLRTEWGTTTTTTPTKTTKKKKKKTPNPPKPPLPKKLTKPPTKKVGKKLREINCRLERRAEGQIKELGLPGAPGDQKTWGRVRQGKNHGRNLGSGWSW